MTKILGMNLTNTDDSIVPVSGHLYVKTPAALDTLLQELRAVGFNIKNLREDQHRQQGVSVERMEKNGWSLWYASLDVSRGKCKSCNGIISTCGILAHAHKCELCGEVTFYKIIDGSTIRFSFIQRDGENHGMADIRMIAKHWDTEQGYLYLYPEVRDGIWLRGERAQEYFDANYDKWEEVTENGQKLIRLKYPNPWNYDVSAINPSDIYGSHWNHSIVKVWEGKEYPEYFGGFPLPDSISIYESWHWPRHKKSPSLHSTILHACGQTDDKGWHYQNGQPWFRPGHWQNMSVFIRHFTELDADAFDKAWPRFRSDGPGGIDDLAKFCHDRPDVKNEPNIGNLLHGFSKVLAGKKLTKGEVAAMADAAKDDSIMSDFRKVLGDRS